MKTPGIRRKEERRQGGQEDRGGSGGQGRKATNHWTARPRPAHPQHRKPSLPFNAIASQCYRSVSPRIAGAQSRLASLALSLASHRCRFASLSLRIAVAVASHRCRFAWLVALAPNPILTMTFVVGHQGYRYIYCDFCSFTLGSPWYPRCVSDLDVLKGLSTRVSMHMTAQAAVLVP